MGRSGMRWAGLVAVAWAGAGWAQEEASPALDQVEAQIAELEAELGAVCAGAVQTELPFVATTLRLLRHMDMDADQRAELGEALAQKVDQVVAVCDY